MGRGQRLLLFFLIFGGGLLGIAALTVFLLILSINNAPREMAVAVAEGVTVTEFAILPDDDAYPATVTVAPDGRLYTGSYATGAIWEISPEGEVLRELPETRERIGSVAGLAVAPDGTLYVIDRTDSDPRAAGGALWAIPPDGETVTAFGAGIDDAEGFVSADDITVDAAGNIYVSDRGRREVWRFNPDGVGQPWWFPPDNEEGDILPTGLVYDPSTETLLIADFGQATVYRVTLDGQNTEVIYSASDSSPGYDGLAVAPDGTIYVAALGERAVVQLTDGEPLILANNFRGASDVTFADGRLFVTNFDQRGLVLPGIQPQLPFALDVITFDGEA